MNDHAQEMSDEGSNSGGDMRGDIKALASRLHALLQQSVVEIAPQVRALVDSSSRDERLIEHTLDRLLDSACIPEGLALFKTLCRHYWYINPGAAADYVDAYRQMWDAESLPTEDSGQSKSDEQAPDQSN